MLLESLSSAETPTAAPPPSPFPHLLPHGDRLDGYNDSSSSIGDLASDMTVSPEVFKANLSCGQLGFDEYHQIQACGFWVEGVAMSILGFVAFVTNMISIYGFTR